MLGVWYMGFAASPTPPFISATPIENPHLSREKVQSRVIFDEEEEERKEERKEEEEDSDSDNGNSDRKPTSLSREKVQSRVIFSLFSDFYRNE